MEDALLAHGPLGIAVAGLSYVVVHLYRKIETLRDKREADIAVLTQLVQHATASNDRYADIFEEFANRLPSWIAGKERR